MSLLLLAGVSAGVSEVGLPLPPMVRRLFSGEMTRRDKIEALKARTGWKHCRCRELVDTKSEAEIEAMVVSEQTPVTVVPVGSDEEAVDLVRGTDRVVLEVKR